MDTSLFYDFRDEVVDYAAFRLGRVLDDIGDKDGFLSYKGEYVGVIDTPEW